MTVLLLSGWTCAGPSADHSDFPDPVEDLETQSQGQPETVVLAGGCFWCTEAVYEQLKGVTEVISGYAGGTLESANYHEVSSGETDHAEAIRITYDPNQMTYGQLLKIFFSVAHDPTQLNRQGPDSGRQYRSTIFYEHEDQKRIAQAYIHQLEKAKVYTHPIVTTLERLTTFYPAEQYHQDYVRLNPDQPYVRQNALPKIEKLRKHFADRVTQSE